MTHPDALRCQLLGPHQIRALAEELDITPTKKLGQNFVLDPNTVRKIVALAHVGSHDHVLEVGSGLGSLTLALLESVEALTAVEIDQRLATRLPQTVAAFAPAYAHNLRVIHKDACAVRAQEWEAVPFPMQTPTAGTAPVATTMPETLAGTTPTTTTGAAVIAGAEPSGACELTSAGEPTGATSGALGSVKPITPPTALVANLPYNVAVPVLLHLLLEFPTITRVMVMVQLEVADRLAAAPGSRVYGVPSVKAGYYGRVTRVATIGKNVFWPAPKIDSGLVSIERWTPATRPWTIGSLPAGTSPEDLRATVFSLVDAAFAQRRKTLRAALASWFGSADAAGEALTMAGIDPAQRGEKLSTAHFVDLGTVALQLRNPQKAQA